MNFFDDHTSPLIERLIDTAHTVRGSSDVATEDRLDEGRLRNQLKGIEESSCGRHDLSTSSVDGVSVEFAVSDVESHTSHGFLAEHTLLRGPLEGRNHRLLDFVHVLHGYCLVNDKVRAFCLWPPGLPTFSS